MKNLILTIFLMMISSSAFSQAFYKFGTLTVTGSYKILTASSVSPNNALDYQGNGLFFLKDSDILVTFIFNERDLLGISFINNSQKPIIVKWGDIGAFNDHGKYAAKVDKEDITSDKSAGQETIYPEGFRTYALQTIGKVHSFPKKFKSSEVSAMLTMIIDGKEKHYIATFKGNNN